MVVYGRSAGGHQWPVIQIKTNWNSRWACWRASRAVLVVLLNMIFVRRLSETCDHCSTALAAATGQRARKPPDRQVRRFPGHRPRSCL
jgi:hypothetical protein